MAAKTRRKAARPRAEPKTWTVLSSGQAVQVEAWDMDITDHGDLVFMGSDGRCTMAYARTAWTTVTLNPEPGQG